MYFERKRVLNHKKQQEMYFEGASRLKILLAAN